MDYDKTYTPNDWTYFPFPCDLLERLPKSYDLEDYQGLVLACKKLKAEFGNEWAKAFNVFISKAVNLKALSVAPVTQLSDSTHIRIHVARSMRGYLHGESAPPISTNAHLFEHLRLLAPIRVLLSRPMSRPPCRV
jgi:hypothetical protein